MKQLGITYANTFFWMIQSAECLPNFATFYSCDECREDLDVAIHWIDEFSKATRNTTHVASVTPRNRNTTAATTETSFRVRDQEKDITDHEMQSRNAT